MDFEALKGHTLLLLGQSRNFSIEEIKELLALDEIKLSQSIEDIERIIIAGRLLNPHLEALIEKYEKEADYEIIDIEVFERMLAQSIHQEGLAFSLKLSNNVERIVSYLKNEILSNEVFISLLPLFDWKGEGLLENDHNRDVCAAITRRFYPNLERNHNIEYSALGLYEVAKATTNSALLSALANLEPLKHYALKDKKSGEYLAVLAIAYNANTPNQTLKMILNSATLDVARLIAKHPQIDESMIENLEAFEDGEIVAYLGVSSLTSSEKKLFFIQSFPQSATKILASAFIDERLFKNLIDSDDYAALASNRSLNRSFQEQIYRTKNLLWHRYLASNPGLESELALKLLASESIEVLQGLAQNEHIEALLLEKLYDKDEPKIHKILASNTKTPPLILKALAQSKEEATVLAVASNASTPVDTLYELFLDRRYMDAVKSNAHFGAHIQEQIGWS